MASLPIIHRKKGLLGDPIHRSKRPDWPKWTTAIFWGAIMWVFVLSLIFTITGVISWKIFMAIVIVLLATTVAAFVIQGLSTLYRAMFGDPEESTYREEEY